MKSLLAFVLLIACASQAYSACLRSSCGCSKPGYEYNNYYDYPVLEGVSYHDQPYQHGVSHCVHCEKPKSSELYPCAYRQHGPCLS